MLHTDHDLWKLAARGWPVWNLFKLISGLGTFQWAVVSCCEKEKKTPTTFVLLCHTTLLDKPQQIDKFKFVSFLAVVIGCWKKEFLNSICVILTTYVWLPFSRTGNWSILWPCTNSFYVSTPAQTLTHLITQPMLARSRVKVTLISPVFACDCNMLAGDIATLISSLCSNFIDTLREWGKD